MSVFERGLTLWIGLALLLGLGLGQLAPSFFSTIGELEYANVNLVIAVLVWLMIYPMMLQVDLSSLFRLTQEPKGLLLTTIINWLVKPFTMALLAVFFFEIVFSDLISPQDAKAYIAGLILLGAAPCTAMVFIWSQLTKGDASYTLLQVSLNDIIMVFAFTPIVAFLLGVGEIIAPWETLLLSAVLFVVIPLLAGVFTQKLLKSKTNKGVEKLSKKLKPVSILSLILTVVILFSLQGDIILSQPTIIAMIAVPLLIQSYGIFFLGYAIAWFLKIPHRISAPAALIGTSNFFELAVAVAIGVFGINSGAALATVVGVLVEVPVMLSLVGFANRTRHYFPT
ncbi:MAG: arsenical-resistance protein [Rhodospirillaceae bacterium]|nr:arsenical-resistance protein [Rhodospirillaceae bacterium]